MFTNTEIITVFHKTTDVEKRLPTWEKHLFYGVYWENCSGQSEENKSTGKGMSESNEILCIIPEKSLKNFIPCIETNVNKDFANSVCFVFQNDKQNFSIEYTRFWDNVVPICVPSDHHNIFETTINDAHAIVSEEDGQYTITYQKDKTNFFFFSVDVPYSECEKIIKLIK